MYRLRGQGASSRGLFEAMTILPRKVKPSCGPVTEYLNLPSHRLRHGTSSVLAFFFFCLATKDSHSSLWLEDLITGALRAVEAVAAGALDGIEALALAEAPCADACSVLLVGYVPRTIGSKVSITSSTTRVVRAQVGGKGGDKISGSDLMAAHKVQRPERGPTRPNPVIHEVFEAKRGLLIKSLHRRNVRE
ncbi:hypothetical protein CRG98_025565 [Punica granatum]|uniref:Uncharacterized protein n=1 Tax=Punica granatum TaxID=22663 RepID=A0A2I0JCU1_PUNGR|nr:hypothetical protein CRG98_025565 [Punica granatum]